MWANLQKVKYSLVQLHHSMTMLNRLQKHPAPKVRKTDGAKLKPKSCFNLWYEAKERDLGTSVSQISCQCVMQHTFAVLGALTLFWWSMLNRCRKKKAAFTKNNCLCRISQSSDASVTSDSISESSSLSLQLSLSFLQCLISLACCCLPLW